MSHWSIRQHGHSRVNISNTLIHECLTAIRQHVHKLAGTTSRAGVHPASTWSKKVAFLAEPTREVWTGITSRHREASRSIPEQNALDNQGSGRRGKGMGSTEKARSVAHACRGALPLYKCSRLEATAAVVIGRLCCICISASRHDIDWPWYGAGILTNV